MHYDSLKRHIGHLKDSHSKLEKELSELETHHLNDTAKAHEIKKRKLKLKDEIIKLENDLLVQSTMPNYG